jgi:hypothetical protein
MPPQSATQKKGTKPNRRHCIDWLLGDVYHGPDFVRLRRCFSSRRDRALVGAVAGCDVMS